MHRTLRRTLREGFPTLFYEKDPYTGRAWNTPISIGEGWTELLVCAASVVCGHEEALHIDSENRTKVIEISEKHGELRVPLKQFADIFCFDVIAYAEYLSSWLCEACGYPGRRFVSAGGWRKTLCDDCSAVGAFGQTWRKHELEDEAYPTTNLLPDLTRLALTAKQQTAIRAYAAFLEALRNYGVKKADMEGPLITAVTLSSPDGVPEFETTINFQTCSEAVGAVAMTQFYCAHTAWRRW